MTGKFKVGDWIEAYTQRATSLRFQIISICITSTLLSLIMYQSFYQFKAFDQKPELLPIESITQKSSAGVVQTGLFIKNFPTFNITKNNFVMDAIVWFIFDPKITPIGLIEQFSFEKGNILYKSKPKVHISSKGTVAKYDILIEFTSNLDYRFFPFDDHYIYITLINKRFTPSKAILTSDDSQFRIAENIYTGGLKFLGKSVEYGYSRAQLTENDQAFVIENPRVVFSLDFGKPGLRRMLLIVIPILLIFFMNLFSLSLDPKLHMRPILTLAVSAVTTLLTYRFVIEQLSPHVGYFTITDYLYTFILLSSFLIFLFSAFSIRTPELSARTKFMRVTTILILHISLITYVYLLFNYLI